MSQRLTSSTAWRMFLTMSSHLGAEGKPWKWHQLKIFTNTNNCWKKRAIPWNTKRSARLRGIFGEQSACENTIIRKMTYAPWVRRWRILAWFRMAITILNLTENLTDQKRWKKCSHAKLFTTFSITELLVNRAIAVVLQNHQVNPSWAKLFINHCLPGNIIYKIIQEFNIFHFLI